MDTRYVRACFRPSQWWAYDPNIEDTEATLMWVYRQSAETRCWLVGYYLPDRSWFGDSEYEGTEEGRNRAMNRVNWLNGGKS